MKNHLLVFERKGITMTLPRIQKGKKIGVGIIGASVVHTWAAKAHILALKCCRPSLHDRWNGNVFYGRVKKMKYERTFLTRYND
jgi:hypothetical protein